MIKHISIKNNQTIGLAQIPLLKYGDFLEHNISQLNEAGKHCVNYFGFRVDGSIMLICCIADDIGHNIHVSSAVINANSILPSFTNHSPAFQIFEREIHENHGVKFSDHPWLKPVRFPFNRSDVNSTIVNYPFYKIESEDIHQVGVGPIHAGVIEPGHFRFICNGEQILHLEIQLGYQHRGIENLFHEKKKLLQRTILAESISGDTVAGHTTAFVNLWESLCNYQAGDDLKSVRTIGLELERIAIHTGGLSAISADIAYQLGSSVFGRLRTPVINFFQEWCGNRLAKGLIRAGENHFKFSEELGDRLMRLFDEYEPDFDEMWAELNSLPSALSRLEKTGNLTNEQASSIGMVGMSARSSEINRDIRSSHPHDMYSSINHSPIIKKQGDVYARTLMRYEEVKQSIGYLRKLIEQIPNDISKKPNSFFPQPGSFCISLTEGWRGEICHCAITDDKGEILHYKVKDPSMHNWLGLALAVRNNEISDFPICNKSFDLSYCGHDL